MSSYSRPQHNFIFSIGFTINGPSIDDVKNELSKNPELTNIIVANSNPIYKVLNNEKQIVYIYTSEKVFFFFSKNFNKYILNNFFIKVL